MKMNGEKTTEKIKTKIKLKKFAIYDYDGIKEDIEKNATLIIFAALFVYLLASFSPISVKWRIIILAFILIFALMHIFLYELQLRENEVGISEQKTNAIRAASYVFMLIFAIALIVIGNIL